MRRNVFREYFSALAEGDPVALGITGLFVVIAVVVGLVAWKFKRDERRHQEEKRKKWGIKDPKDKK